MSAPTPPEGRDASRSSFFKRHENATVLSIFGSFVVVITLLQLVTTDFARYPTFLSPVNLLNVLQQVSVPGIVAIGMTMVMICGGIDLSVGMLASLVSIVTALGISKWQLGVPGAILLGVASAVALETAMGFIISRVKVEPFIITLGGMITFQGIALLLCNSREVVMRGELNFIKTNLIAGAKDPVTGLNLVVPPYVLVFFLVAVLAGVLLKFTKFGRRVYAVGNNPEAAFLAGIDVRAMRLAVYTIMGVLVGLAAVMLLARINVGIITLGQNLEIDTIAMVVIGGTALKGGKGSVLGTIIGVFFLGSIGNAMNMLRLPSEVQFVAKGLVIVVAVSAGHVSQALARLRSSRHERAPAASPIGAKGG